MRRVRRRYRRRVSWGWRWGRNGRVGDPPTRDGCASMTVLTHDASASMSPMPTQRADQPIKTAATTNTD
jgi:hypothetical protein